MKIYRGLNHPGITRHCALTIGNFDGVHLGHQAMLRSLKAEATQRNLPACVMTFEPHPRDYFAAKLAQPELAPTRISTLRDKLSMLAECGVDQIIIMPFNNQLAALSPQDFIQDLLHDGLGVRYLLVGDDFRFGAKRAGDFDTLQKAGAQLGFELIRLTPQKLNGKRMSSTALRQALGEGRMKDAAALLGRPYTISGHVVHGRKLGRVLGESSLGANDGFRTINLRFSRRSHAWKPAASGIFIVRVLGLGKQALNGVANLGVRPSIDPSDINGGRVLLETHCLEWPSELGPEGAYGKIVSVELLHKLHDEFRYHSLAALTQGMTRDIACARQWLARTDTRI